MRRLFSTFAPGWPGAGLLLMRLVAGASLIIHGFARLQTGPSIQFMALPVVAIIIGILLLAGLWTPVAGALQAIIEVWTIFARETAPSMHVLLAALGVSLVMLGPGAWSVDARLFGRKRIDIRSR